MISLVQVINLFAIHHTLLLSVMSDFFKEQLIGNYRLVNSVETVFILHRPVRVGFSQLAKSSVLELEGPGPRYVERRDTGLKVENLQLLSGQASQ